MRCRREKGNAIDRSVKAPGAAQGASSLHSRLDVRLSHGERSAGMSVVVSQVSDSSSAASLPHGFETRAVMPTETQSQGESWGKKQEEGGPSSTVENR